MQTNQTDIEVKKQERAGLEGVYRFTFTDTVTGKVRVEEYHNKIPDAGLAALASQLADASPSVSPMTLSYTELGTGTNAPAAGDTALQTPTFRKAIASRTRSGAIVYASAYYTAAECSGTFREAGIYIGGSSTPGSGTLFSRVAINITKANTETLTIDYTLTLSSVN